MIVAGLADFHFAAMRSACKGRRGKGQNCGCREKCLFHVISYHFSLLDERNQGPVSPWSWEWV
jgi:hypothetical protein